MENANSSINSSMKRRKSFRKLRWKNYLNRLANLWLLCGNFLVECRNGGGNEIVAANLLNKSVSTLILQSSATSILTQSSKQSEALSGSAELYHFNRNAEFYNSSHGVSYYATHDGSIVNSPNLNVNTSNKSFSNENYFHSIESSPERTVMAKNSINHNISSDHSSETAAHKGPKEIIKPETIVNTSRMVNDITTGRVKKWGNLVKNVSKKGENELSIHYNQSLLRTSQPPQNQGKVGKKVKNISKASEGGAKARSKSVSDKASRKLSKVSLLGLFEMTTHLGTRWEGKSELAAAELAVKHINERGLLPGYILELITNDTQVTSRARAGAKAYKITFAP